LRTIFFKKISNYYTFKTGFILVLIFYTLFVTAVVLSYNILSGTYYSNFILIFIDLIVYHLHLNSLLTMVPAALLVVPALVATYAISVIQTLHRLYCAEAAEIDALYELLLRIGAKAFAAIPLPTSFTDEHEKDLFSSVLAISN